MLSRCPFLPPVHRLITTPEAGRPTPPWRPVLTRAPRQYVQLASSSSQRFRPVATAANAKSVDHIENEFRGPATLDRLVACLVYVMPICEGLHRLAVVFVRIAQYNLLDWLIWTELRGPAITPSMDMATLMTLRQACQALYSELAVLAKQLLLLAPPLPMLTRQKHGLFSIHASPANCGTLASVAYIGLVSSLAICAHDRQQLSRRESRQNNNAADTWGLRLPQLIMAASACAIMLRLSLVDMQGASGLAKDTYKFVAVSLTLATVCTSFAQILQVAFGAFDEGNEVIQQLVQQAGNIAWLHCALSLVEWVLMLSTPCAWPAKLQVGTIAVVTNALVLAVRHKALRTDWLQAQR